MTMSTFGRALEQARLKEDAISGAARAVGGRVISDKRNVNGRFVTIEVPGETIRVRAIDLKNRLRGQFGKVSQVSVKGGGTYGFQGMERFPSITGRGVIHKSSEFGDITHFIVRPSD